MCRFPRAQPLLCITRLPQHHPIASSGIKNPPPLPPRVAFSSPQLPTTSDPYAEPTAAQIAYPSSVQLAALPSPPPYQHQQPALPQQQQYADPYSDYSQARPSISPVPFASQCFGLPSSNVGG